MKRLLTISLLLIAMLASTAHGQKLVDEFLYSNAEDSMARLDNFMIELQNDPNAQGYIIFYGPRSPKKGELAAHMKQLPAYLSESRKFPKERITLVNGGSREADRVTLEFWNRAPGDDTPKATKTFDLKKVKFQKSKFKGNSLYWCC